MSSHCPKKLELIVESNLPSVCVCKGEGVA